MHFSVIYSFEVPFDDTVTRLQPPNHHKWELTESYIEDGYKHRKYASVLNKEQFIEFVRERELSYEAETMGMIGAPGFGISWMPAVSLMGPLPGFEGNAYVCPVPDDNNPIWRDDKLVSRYIDRAFDVLRTIKN